MIGLGAWPSVGLAQARKLKDEAKRLLAQNIDPVDWRRQQESATQDKNRNTFSKIPKFGLI